MSSDAGNESRKLFIKATHCERSSNVREKCMSRELTKKPRRDVRGDLHDGALTLKGPEKVVVKDAVKSHKPQKVWQTKY